MIRNPEQELNHLKLQTLKHVDFLKTQDNLMYSTSLEKFSVGDHRL